MTHDTAYIADWNSTLKCWEIKQKGQTVLQLTQSEYLEYRENFDPSPITYGDDYLYPMDYESWVEENLEECLVVNEP